jgi:predicted nuclease of predicted toxin-antitoxin system
MARFYADEHFPLAVVEFLRAMGHDVLTVQAAGNANIGIPDENVLAFAISQERAILTWNRQHFVRLHHLQPEHTGIIVCSKDINWERQAMRINEASSSLETLNGQLIRVYRPQV